MGGGAEVEYVHLVAQVEVPCVRLMAYLVSSKLEVAYSGIIMMKITH